MAEKAETEPAAVETPRPSGLGWLPDELWHHIFDEVDATTMAKYAYRPKFDIFRNIKFILWRFVAKYSYQIVIFCLFIAVLHHNFLVPPNFIAF
jgi:hypothetical protein